MHGDFLRTSKNAVMQTQSAVGALCMYFTLKVQLLRISLPQSVTNQDSRETQLSKQNSYVKNI